MKPASFPPPYKFEKLNLYYRGPTPIIDILLSAKNLENLKKSISQISKRDRRRIERKTRLQSECSSWFIYRQGCISGTISRQVVNCIQRDTFSIPLNKAISKTGQRPFSNEATRYGLENEKLGIDALWSQFKKSHRSPKLQKSGIRTDKDLAYLVGSPDIILSCENCCCDGVRYFVGEVKCPFRLKESGIQNWKTLEYLTSNSELKKTHQHYYQLTLYCGIVGAHIRYFVIWAPDGNIILEVTFDKDLFDHIKSCSEKYYYEHYIKWLRNFPQTSLQTQ